MPDYRVVADSEVQPDAPVTSSLGFALRDNPAGIAEGAPGAPKVRSAALNLTAGSGSRTTVGTIFQLNNIGRLSAFHVSSAVRAGSSGIAAISYQTSTDGGSSWGSDNVIISFSGSPDVSTSIQSFDIITVGANVTNIRFRMSADSSPFSYATCAAVGIRGVSP